MFSLMDALNRRHDRSTIARVSAGLAGLAAHRGRGQDPRRWVVKQALRMWN